MDESRHCCYLDAEPPLGIPCTRLAEWAIYSDAGYTEACTEHVGYLLDDSEKLVIYPIRQEVT